MLAFAPHFALVGLAAAGTLLFLRKGGERKDMLAMGCASALATLWMLTVVMTEMDVDQGSPPFFWLSLGNALLVPSLFFVFLSVILLDQHYAPKRSIRLRAWLPVALATFALTGVQILDPAFFVGTIELVAPAPGHRELSAPYGLRFSVGPGYYLFLVLFGYVMYQLALRFPAIVHAMQLPESDRRTRFLFTLAMVTVFWGVAFEILPTLQGFAAPGLLRLVGVALAVCGAVYALVLGHSLHPALLLRSAVFFALRVSLLTVPVAVALIFMGERLIRLEPLPVVLSVLGVVIILDSINKGLMPWFDRLALRRRYDHNEAASRIVTDLLHLRELAPLAAAIDGHLRITLGAAATSLWVIPHFGSEHLVHARNQTTLDLRPEVRQALLRCNRALTFRDFQLDPRLEDERGYLEDFFVTSEAEVVLPLVDEGRLKGVLVLGRKASAEDYFAMDVELLNQLCEPLGLALAITLSSELAKAGRPAKLLGRSEFSALVEQQWHRAQRYREPLALVLLRMDLVAGGSEESAHLQLGELAEDMLRTLRAFDVPGFYDPRTLAFLLPQTARAGAEVAAKRLGEWLERSATMHGAPLRFLAGIATRDAGIAQPADLFTFAEQALRAAAQAGSRTADVGSG